MVSSLDKIVEKCTMNGYHGFHETGEGCVLRLACPLSRLFIDNRSMWFSFILAIQKQMPVNNTGGMVLNRKTLAPRHRLVEAFQRGLRGTLQRRIIDGY